MSGQMLMQEMYDLANQFEAAGWNQYNRFLLARAKESNPHISWKIVFPQNMSAEERKAADDKLHGLMQAVALIIYKSNPKWLLKEEGTS